MVKPYSVRQKEYEERQKGNWYRIIFLKKCRGQIWKSASCSEETPRKHQAYKEEKKKTIISRRKPFLCKQSLGKAVACASKDLPNVHQRERKLSSKS